MNVNVWLVITQTAKDTLRDLMDDQEYDGQHLTAVKIFRKMADYGTVERMFKSPTIAGSKRYLYSVTLPASQKAKDAIDYLLAEYPNQIAVAGAWKWDGLQVGTSRDEDDNIVGTPTYPINQTQLLKFMPDVIEYDANGDVVSTTPAIEITDINLEQGMVPRKFD